MKHEILIPAQVLVSKVSPVIVDEGRIYAREIKVKLTDAIILDVEECTGIVAEKYESMNAECILEVIEGEFMPVPPPKEEEAGEIPEPTILKLEYLGYRSGSHFFPAPDDSVKRNGKLDAQLYRASLEEQFLDYSEDGFPLSPFGTHATMQMDNGTVLLINKDIFKDELRATKRNSKVYIKLNAARLLSITAPRTLPTKEELEERKRQKAMQFQAPKKKKKWGVF